MELDTWKLKLDAANSPKCDLCGGETRWGGGKGRFNFCDEHNTWKMYFSIRYRSTPKS